MSIPAQPMQFEGSASVIQSPARKTVWLALAGALLIAGLALVAYWPSLSGGFIWDDELLLSNNDLIKAPNGPYLFWCTTYPPDYWPMTNTSFWLEWRQWETNSTGYHVTNLALHIASALLVWCILKNLAIPGAFLAALLFAVHPVNVESVAWIAQRKNTLAMFFFLLSILSYLPMIQQRSTDTRLRTAFCYALSLFTFVLAMLSKGSVAVLPLLLLGMLWWQRRQITLTDVARLLPFCLVAIALTVVNIYFQKHAGAVTLDISFTQRLLGAGAVVWFYLSKALVPIDLIFIYPYWRVRPADLLWWLPLLGAVVVTALLLHRHNSRHATWIRPVLFAWGFFCVALLPVLGFVDFGFMQYSLVADHYQHLAILGVVALVAAAWSTWQQQAVAAARSAARALAVAAVVILTLLTRNQSALYADAVTIFQATLRSNPDCWVAYNNLGVKLASGGQPQDAKQNFEHALALKPDYAEAHYNLGNYFANAHQPNEAFAQYQQALSSKPDYPEAHNNLATLMVQAGQIAPAIEHYEFALQSRPSYAEAYNNLGVALAGSGQLPPAIERFQQALQLKPNNPEARHNLGMALANSGQLRDAVDQFEESLRLDPSRLQTYAKLTSAYLQLQQPSEAIATAEKALAVAQSSNQTAMAKKIDDWLQQYRTQQGSSSSMPAPSEFIPPTPAQ